jgi:HrpA-like RNA helicase
MTGIAHIACKDCGSTFAYADESAAADRLAGRSRPERCPACRKRHSKEYRSLGVSHYDVLQLRTDGEGGLASYARERPAPRLQGTARAAREPLPIEAIVGSPAQPGTLLYGLLRDPRRMHLVVGPTGSGKSTWLPFRLLACDALTAKGPILVTQPRIPATEGPVRFVAELYYGDPALVGAGLAIGYRHSQVETPMTDQANRLLYVTDGTLLNWLQSGEARRFSAIMIDEAHERSVNIDKILTLLRLKMPQWPHLQLIIASATVDAEGFRGFFGGDKEVALYQSEGFTYPILELFSDETLVHCPDLWPSAEPPPKPWERIDEAVRQKEWLGPECWRWDGMAGYRLRYYPQFESLVLQGAMTKAERRALQGLFGDAAWAEAVGRLAAASRRKRRVGDDREIPITDSIRQIGDRTRPGKRLPPQTRDRLLHATADAILGLVERDREEAPKRLTRWQRRQGLGWPDLREPLPVGHVLAFLPTTTTIETCAELVRKGLKERGWEDENRVLRFFREAPQEEKELAVAATDPGRPLRKLVIGSNLAETSLTLDGLLYVVDSGLICQEQFDAERGKTLPTVFHSQAGCRQRVGRVGRKEPGEAYRLYTREELEGQAPYTTPDVARLGAEQVVLDLVRAGVPAELDTITHALMSPPPREEIERSLAALGRFQALDAEGDVTHRGEELARLQSDSFLATQLLCEADRFGVLWEMAVFLAFTELQDSEAPPLGYEGQGRPAFSRWLGVWEPTVRPIYDDAGADDETASSRKGGSTWDNPYRLADALLEHPPLKAPCLDDLELYLRLWQGWFPLEEDRRRKWARARGLNHAALTKIAATQRAKLEPFWAFKEKGELQRDVDFTRLDLVRLLYAAGRPEGIYRRDAGQPERFYRHPAEDKPRAGYVHQESVWADPTAPEHQDPLSGPRQRGLCAATARPVSNAVVLRHLVWLDEEWIKDGPPSFAASPLALARRFSAIRDHPRAALGEQPFLLGTGKAGLPQPIPAIEPPPPRALQTLRERHLAAKDTQAPSCQASVGRVIQAPHLSSRPAVFLKIGEEQALLPLEADDGMQTPREGDQLAVQLIERQGLLLAVPESAGRGRPARRGRGDRVAPFHRAQRAPMPDAGLTLLAEVVRAETRYFRGILARIAEDPYSGCEIQVNYPLLDRLLQQEAKPKRRLMVKVGGRKGPRAYGTLQRWMDGGACLDTTANWPQGSQLEVKVQARHEKQPAFLWVQPLEMPFLRWMAPVGIKNAQRAEPGRELLVTVTDWKRGHGHPWPFLRFERWLDDQG